MARTPKDLDVQFRKSGNQLGIKAITNKNIEASKEHFLLWTSNIIIQF
jgi:hypothetical protein